MDNILDQCAASKVHSPDRSRDAKTSKSIDRDLIETQGWQYQSWVLWSRNGLRFLPLQAANRSDRFASKDWSPPAANISMPGEIVAEPPVPIVALRPLETSVVVSDVVKPTDDLIVAVPEDASSSSD